MTRLTADELIRPMHNVTCGKCGRGDCVIYPIGDGEQSATFCPTCSPAWSQAFMEFLTDQYRVSLGLEPLDPNHVTIANIEDVAAMPGEAGDRSEPDILGFVDPAGSGESWSLGPDELADLRVLRDRRAAP